MRLRATGEQVLVDKTKAYSDTDVPQVTTHCGPTTGVLTQEPLPKSAFWARGCWNCHVVTIVREIACLPSRRLFMCNLENDRFGSFLEGVCCGSTEFVGHDVSQLHADDNR